MATACNEASCRMQVCLTSNLVTRNVDKLPNHPARGWISRLPLPLQATDLLLLRITTITVDYANTAITVATAATRDYANTAITDLYYCY